MNAGYLYDNRHQPQLLRVPHEHILFSFRRVESIKYTTIPCHLLQCQLLSFVDLIIMQPTHQDLKEEDDDSEDDPDYVPPATHGMHGTWQTI